MGENNTLTPREALAAALAELMLLDWHRGDPLVLSDIGHICKARDVLRAALAAPMRNCDVARNWLSDLYCHFKPPKGMREMPPEWVDAVMAFCNWLVQPADRKKVEK